MTKVIGYKCFNEDMTNSYGIKFELNKIYKTEGNIEFGTQGNGFHMCERLEDTLRYFDAINNSVKICLVCGEGKVITRYDTYYDYDILVVEKLTITKILSRDEIIEQILRANKFRVKRFVMGFKLTNEELSRFKEAFKTDYDTIATIEYYQENNLNAFQKTKYIRNSSIL